MAFLSRGANDAVHRRLALLVRAGEFFHRSLDLDETLGNVARMAVESFADLCLVDLVNEETGDLFVSVGAHRDRQIERSLEAVISLILCGETRGTHPAREVAQSGRPFFVPVFDEAALLDHASSDQHEAFMRSMDYRSKIIVPVVAQGNIYGALTFVRVGATEPFDVGDKEAAEELGRRAGLAVSNAKQYRREQATQRRLALLVRAGELFHQSLDVEETLGNVARMAVESFAELCLVDLIDEVTKQLYVCVGAHRDPALGTSLAEMVAPVLQAETRSVHPARHVAQTGDSFFVPRFDEAALLAHASSDAHESFMRRMHYRSKIVVPIVANNEIFGALTFVRVDDSPTFDVADMEAAAELGRRAGLAVSNAKRYGREQATQRRLTLLVRAGELFHQSLDLEQTLSNVAQTSVESFSDLCLFDLIDERTDLLYVSVGAHRDPSIQSALKAMVTPILQSESRGVHPARYVAKTGKSFFVPLFDEATLLEHASSDAHEAFMRLMRYRSKIVVPVEAHGALFGALTFVRTDESDSFDEADMRAAEELGRRAGLAVANAKRYSHEQHVAETLQQAFLNDELPDNDAFHFSAIYQPAQNEGALCGDWYDAFSVDDFTVVTIGDVTGKGLDAARLMVQLRQWVRLAAIVTRDPAGILSLLNEALVAGGRDELATAFIGVIDRRGTMMRYASAGHPPPIVKPFHGVPYPLPLDYGPPVGVGREMVFSSQELALDGVRLVLLYTDGLTEAGRDPIAGQRAVEELLAGDDLLYSANPARFVSRLVAQRTARDDVAILAIGFGSSAGRWAFDVSDAAAAYAIKREFIAAITDRYGAAADTNACEVIFSELVGNALRYAPGRLNLGLSFDEQGLWLHVMDEGPGFDSVPSLPADLWSESGRGLFLIKALSNDVMMRRLPMFGSYVKALLPLNASATSTAVVRVPAKARREAPPR